MQGCKQTAPGACKFVSPPLSLQRRYKNLENICAHPFVWTCLRNKLWGSLAMACARILQSASTEKQARMQTRLNSATPALEKINFLRNPLGGHDLDLGIDFVPLRTKNWILNQRQRPNYSVSIESGPFFSVIPGTRATCSSLRAWDQKEKTFVAVQYSHYCSDPLTCNLADHQAHLLKSVGF